VIVKLSQDAGGLLLELGSKKRGIPSSASLARAFLTVFDESSPVRSSLAAMSSGANAQWQHCRKSRPPRPVPYSSFGRQNMSMFGAESRGRQ